MIIKDKLKVIEDGMKKLDRLLGEKFNNIIHESPKEIWETHFYDYFIYSIYKYMINLI